MKKLSINVKVSLLFLLVFFITYGIDFFTFKSIPITDLILCTFADLAFILILRKIKTVYYLGILFFTVLAQYFGGMLKLYEIIPYYDVFLHFASGILLVLLADYLYTLLLTRYKKADVPLLIRLILDTAVAISAAAFWEIWEYSGDTLLKLQAQGGLDNTMRDIIAGTLGGIIGFFVMRKLLTKKL